MLELEAHPIEVKLNFQKYICYVTLKVSPTFQIPRPCESCTPSRHQANVNRTAEYAHIRLTDEAMNHFQAPITMHDIFHRFQQECVPDEPFTRNTTECILYPFRCVLKN